MSTESSWFVGSNGNLFRDMGGFRYCVCLIDPRDNASGYAVARNGVEIAGLTCVGAPAGFKTLAAAKNYAEQSAGA